MDEDDAWGGTVAASLRGLPRGRLSAWAGLPVDVPPALLEGGEGPWSEGSTVLSSDDILNKTRGDTHTIMQCSNGSQKKPILEQSNIASSHSDQLFLFAQYILPSTLFRTSTCALM